MILMMLFEHNISYHHEIGLKKFKGYRKPTKIIFNLSESSILTRAEDSNDLIISDCFIGEANNDLASEGV